MLTERSEKLMNLPDDDIAVGHLADVVMIDAVSLRQAWRRSASRLQFMNEHRTVTCARAELHSTKMTPRG